MKRLPTQLSRITIHHTSISVLTEFLFLFIQIEKSLLGVYLYMSKLYKHLFLILSRLIDSTELSAREMILAYLDFWLANIKVNTSRFFLKDVDFDSDEVQRASSEFLKYDVFFFVTRIAGKVAQPEKWRNLFSRSPYNVQSIILNLLVLEKHVSEKDLVDIKKGCGKRIFEKYKKAIRNLSCDDFIPIQDTDFEEAIYSIFAIPLNSQGKRIDDSYSAVKRATTIARIMNEDLQLPKEEQIKLCYLYYCKRDKPSEIADQLCWSPFVPQSEEKRISHVRSLCNEMAGISALDIICALYLSKKSEYQNDPITGKHAVKHLEQNNDVALETGMIYSSFFSDLTLPFGSQKNAVIFFPSPLFVQKVSMDKNLQGCDITIVLSESTLANLMNWHFSSEHYSGKNGKNLHFVSLVNYVKQYGHGMPFTHALYFQHQDTVLAEETIYSSFCNASGNTTLFALTADYKESNKSQLFNKSVKK